MPSAVHRQMVSGDRLSHIFKNHEKCSESVGDAMKSSRSKNALAVSSFAWANRARIPAISAACNVRSIASFKKAIPTPCFCHRRSVEAFRSVSSPLLLRMWHLCRVKETRLRKITLHSGNGAHWGIQCGTELRPLRLTQRKRSPTGKSVIRPGRRIFKDERTDGTIRGRGSKPTSNYTQPPFSYVLRLTTPILSSI